MMEDVLIPIVAILSTIALPIVTALVLILKKLNADHNERMALINQGIIPPNEPKKKTNPNRMVSLRNGIILAALGIGILVGFLCSQYLVIGEENKFWIMSASIVFFLGVGYLVYFLATRNMPRESQIEQPCE
ncbi:MAG: DUF6249 domain-containing protein [Dysgonamonadaceae bacterium]|jgi:sterol desaturase/sphingolipid hydroxylase (fatty acid hydroxylase superfamily)|nr:hypothetical protein [Bacteroidales bacterium]